MSAGFLTIEPGREKAPGSPLFGPSAFRSDPRLERETYEYYGYRPPAQSAGDGG